MVRFAALHGWLAERLSVHLECHAYANPLFPFSFIDLSSPCAVLFLPLPPSSKTSPPLQPNLRSPTSFTGGCMGKPSAPYMRFAAFCLASAAWPLSHCLAWCALWKSATRSMVSLQKELFLTQWNDIWINCHVPKRPIVDWSSDEKGNYNPSMKIPTLAVLWLLTSAGAALNKN